MTRNLEVLEISRCPRDQFLMDLKTFPVPGPAVDDRLGRAVAPRAVIGHCKEKLQDKVRRTHCRVGVMGGRQGRIHGGGGGGGSWGSGPPPPFGGPPNFIKREKSVVRMRVKTPHFST